MDLYKTYQQLFKQYSYQHWWPVFGSQKTRMFEICVGAILTQNTAWTNVQKAIKNLIAAKIMSPRAVLTCPTRRIKKLIRSAGYYNQKAKKIRLFSRWLLHEYDGKLEVFFRTPLIRAREELLNLWGIGEETADSILLYAGNKPIFVIDAYTRRLLAQRGIRYKTYREYQNYFHSCLPRSAKLFNEFHALIVVWGKEKSAKQKITA